MGCTVVGLQLFVVFFTLTDRASTIPSNIQYHSMAVASGQQRVFPLFRTKQTFLLFLLFSPHHISIMREGSCAAEGSAASPAMHVPTSAWWLIGCLYNSSPSIHAACPVFIVCTVIIPSALQVQPARRLFAHYPNDGEKPAIYLSSFTNYSLFFVCISLATQGPLYYALELRMNPFNCNVV